MFSAKDRKNFETVLSAVKLAFNGLFRFNHLHPPERGNMLYQSYLEACREFAEKFTNPYADDLAMRALEQYAALEDRLNKERKSTRKKCRNAMFTFLYPGYASGVGDCPDNAVQVAIPDSGEWVSISGGRIGGESSSAVFYSPDDLRQLAKVLDEAADLFEAARSKHKDYAAYVETLRGKELDELNQQADSE